MNTDISANNTKIQNFVDEFKILSSNEAQNDFNRGSTQKSSFETSPTVKNRNRVTRAQTALEQTSKDISIATHAPSDISQKINNIKSKAIEKIQKIEESRNDYARTHTA